MRTNDSTKRILLPSLAASALALALVAPSAQAAKWSECPSAPPLYRSALGATSAPFIHPGHELRIVLNSAQVAASGGFATGGEGNLVEISVSSLFGEPIALAPRTAVAVDTAVLSFPFPDTAAETGRMLAGPTEIRVRSGGHEIARIDAADLVAVPPANDVTSLVLGETPRQVVYGALGADGDLWVPARFRGDPKAMPSCPGQFIMPVPIEIGGASVPGLVARGANPLGRVRRASLYLADFDMNGASYYGTLLRSRVPLSHVAGSVGVAICQLNDAVDVVLRVAGRRAWSRSPRSVMRDVIAGSSAVPLVLQGSEPLPARGVIARTGRDSFGGECSPIPSHAGDASRRPE